jgi:hypothetical protein
LLKLTRPLFKEAALLLAFWSHGPHVPKQVKKLYGSFWSLAAKEPARFPLSNGGRFNYAIKLHPDILPVLDRTANTKESMRRLREVKLGWQVLEVLESAFHFYLPFVLWLFCPVALL